MDNATENNTPDRLIPLTEWPDYHPWPSVGGLRHLVFYAKKKGFTQCYVKKGGRILIRERNFFKWASCSDAA